jgi:hypothetical protein
MHPLDDGAIKLSPQFVVAVLRNGNSRLAVRPPQRREPALNCGDAKGGGQIETNAEVDHRSYNKGFRDL